MHGNACREAFRDEDVSICILNERKLFYVKCRGNIVASKCVRDMRDCVFLRNSASSGEILHDYT